MFASQPCLFSSSAQSSRTVSLKDDDDVVVVLKATLGFINIKLGHTDPFACHDNYDDEGDDLDYFA